MSTLRSTRRAPFQFPWVPAWVVCITFLFAAWPGMLALGHESGEPPQERWSYYYFKESRPLTLDLSRVAVLRAPDGEAAAAAGADLSPYGLDDASLKPMAVHGWSFATTTAAVRTDTAIEEAVSQIAAREPIDFVSPVFLDDQGGPIVITPYVLVGFDRSLDASRAEAILAESGAGTIIDRDWANMKRAYRLQAASRDGFDVLQAANELARRPEVTFAEPDMMLTGHAALIPDDTYFPYLWGLHNDGAFAAVLSCTLVDFDMDAPEAWDITTGDPSIIVAVLDLGVQQDHPDLNLYTPGFDATGEGGGGGPVNACDNHGTPVAGCVSGIINNNLGIVGIAPGVKSASARIGIAHPECDDTFTTQASWVVASLAWAESIGARITNNSWGYTGGSSPASVAQKYADTRAAGMVHFAAAGNTASDTILDPAALPSVNAVAALDPCGNRAVFSNYGVGLAFSAPGHYGICTDRTGADGYNDGIGDGACVPDNGTLGCSSDAGCHVGETCFLVSVDYALVAGTSFASPYAAGVAALALSVNPNLTADHVEDLLKASSVDLGPAGYDTDYGWGFVNAANAVQLAQTGLLPCPNDFAAASNGFGGDRLSRFGCVSALEPPPAAKGVGTAIRVKFRTLYNISGSDPDGASQCPDRALLTMPQPSLNQFEPQTRWLGAPVEVVDEALPTPPNYIAAPLVCTPEEAEARDWSPAGLAASFGGDADDTRVYFYDSAVVPCSVYEVAQCGDPLDESTCSEPVLIFTSRMADAWPPFEAAGQPSFTDINALVNKFKGIPFTPGANPLGGVPEWHSLLKGNVVGDYDVTVANRKVGFLDIGVSVDGFKGLPYREQGPCNAGTGFDNCGNTCTVP